MKRLLRMCLSLIAVLALAGCGFHLRGSGGVTPMAQNLYLEGDGAEGRFATLFSGIVGASGGRMVSSPAQANGIVHLYHVISQKRSITLNRLGKSTEFDLIYRVVFDVRTPKGEVVLPRQEIEVKRDYFNDQTIPLAQTSEEGVIRAEIEREVAQTLLRRAAYALKREPVNPS